MSRMQNRPGHFTAGLLLTALLAACTVTPESPGKASNQITAYANKLQASAAEAEPWITPILLYLAEDLDAEMAGLDFRFKSRESMIRKIESKMLERGIEHPEDVSIRDALRYTMTLDDEPAGSHDESIAKTLTLFENVGHTALTVKNYWPRGDDYSGVNTTLQAPNGLHWELQFHTPASFDLKMSSHVNYEQVRQASTPLPVKQALFDEEASKWNLVDMPVDILEPHSLHKIEVIIQRPRP